MNHQIPFYQYLLNLILAVFTTAILAIPIAWLISLALIFALKGLRYRTLQFAPFETVFVSEKEPSKRLGGDFRFHPHLFEKDGIQYSAEINGNLIEFITNGNGWTGDPCQATVNKRSIGCEEIAYFSDPNVQNFIRLTGDVGVTTEQAQQLNIPHHQFDEQLEIVRTSLFVLLPISLFLCIRAIGRRWIQREIPQLLLTRRQKIGLQLPWAIGLIAWGALRAMF